MIELPFSFSRALSMKASGTVCSTDLFLRRFNVIRVEEGIVSCARFENQHVN